MRKHPRPFRKLRGLRPLATFCALGALVFLLAFLGETQPAARQVASIPPGGEVRLFEEQGGLCLLAYSGQAPAPLPLYALDTATGKTLSNYVSFQAPCVGQARGQQPVRRGATAPRGTPCTSSLCPILA